MPAGRTMLTWLAILVVVLALLALLRDRIWSVLGPADLGPVAFETLQRRASPNDALACPPDLCAARSDVAPPVLTADAARVQTAMAAVIASEPRVTKVASDPAAGTERYVQRSALMRYPDTIVVRYVSLPDGKNTMALYSRSQLGYSDLGVNRARIVRWLTKLEKELAASEPQR